jgi:hypothetical protein
MDRQVRLSLAAIFWTKPLGGLGRWFFPCLMVNNWGNDPLNCWGFVPGPRGLVILGLESFFQANRQEVVVETLLGELSVLACTLKQQKRQGLCQEFTQATIFNVDLSANREPENKMVWGIHHFWTNPNHMWFVIAYSFQLLSS